MKKDTMSRKIELRLPVSRKFYTSLMSRIEQSLTAVGADSSVVASAKECIDAYIRTSGQPADSHPASVRLVFALLRTEIDKAMARSAAARKRRKSSAVTKECTAEVNTEDVNVEEHEAVQPVLPVLNRRERRLRERQERRRLKRQARNRA